MADQRRPSFSAEERRNNPYFELTERFNGGRLRAIVTSGQACVFHRIAFASKDGDWIVRLATADLLAVIDVLADCGAKYRLGAPLDLRWQAQGWSSHLEFAAGPLRLRTDFLGHPPRISAERLAAVWLEAELAEAPVCTIPDLIAIKRTQREKDYPIIGSLSELLTPTADIFLYSTSAQRLITTALTQAAICTTLIRERPLLALALDGDEFALETAIDGERRRFQHDDRARMQRYTTAMAPWARRWKEIETVVSAMPLREAHAFLCEQADATLPRIP